MRVRGNTFNEQIMQEYKFIMQSLVLYKSDIKGNDFKQSESSLKKVKFMMQKFPLLISKLESLEMSSGK